VERGTLVCIYLYAYVHVHLHEYEKALRQEFNGGWPEWREVRLYVYMFMHMCMYTCMYMKRPCAAEALRVQGGKDA